MNLLRRHTREVVLVCLILSNIIVWITVYQRRSSDTLSVYFLDVGQGDAIFIDSPTHGRVLIDGGPNRKVLAELGKILPFADRRIDAVIETHPDKDHIGGLPEIVSRYKTSSFLEPGVESDNSTDDELRSRLASRNVQTFLARRGMVLDFKDGVQLVILFPDRDVSTWETNDASVVAKLIYKNHSFLLTGDAALKTENILMSMDKNGLKSTVLKAGHHGSRTSTSEYFASAVAAQYAIISAGKDNSYGHPHEQVLNNLNKTGAEILSTAEEGTIKFETNGDTLKLK